MKHRLVFSLVTASVLASQSLAGIMGYVAGRNDWAGIAAVKRLMSRVLLGVFASLVWVTAQSAVPLWTVVPAPGSNPTQTVPESSTSTVQYVLQNQSGKTKHLVIQSIPGIVQTTTCQLAPKGQASSSCILNLAITGSSLPKAGVHGGPNVCEDNGNGAPNSNQCYRPSVAHVLNIAKGTAEQAAIAVTPAALDLVANSGTPGFLTITNNSTSITAQNVAALLPTSWTDVIQDTSNCVAIAPNGGNCVLQFTPGATAHGAVSVVIVGSNTTQLTAQLSVSAPAQASLSVTGGPISLVAGCPTAGTLTVENTSVTVAAADIIVDLDALSGDITETNNCPNPLPAGDSCTINLVGVNPASASNISIQGSNASEVLVGVGVEAALTIGDNYFGGIVFQVDACNTGKVVTGPLDGNSERSSLWSSQTNNITTDFLNGAQNTTNIINTDTGCTDESNCAAFLCRNFDVAQSGWYLPAIDELQNVALALCPDGISCIVGEFINTNYWSSSQSSNQNAWGDPFPMSNAISLVKSTVRPVRCVRAFTA